MSITRKASITRRALTSIHALRQKKFATCIKLFHKCRRIIKAHCIIYIYYIYIIYIF